MAQLIHSDLVVATAFRDRWQAWEPLFDKNNIDEQQERISEIKVSIQDCMRKNFICENSALGNIFSSASEERVKEYFDKNYGTFYLDGKGNYHVNPQAVKAYVGSYDLNKFFAKKLISEGIYPHWILQAFNFVRSKTQESNFGR